MSLIGSYRYSSAVSGASVSGATIVNFTGFKVSGLADSNALACCMYVWNASLGKWVPYSP